MSLNIWHHDHTFGQDRVQPGEKRVLIVIAITFVTMIIEIVAGLQYGSMALLADGLHMGTHAAALGISAIAYVVARKYARDARFNFGTGKINALGGFTSALMLAIFAIPMAVESFDRLLNPTDIQFTQAIIVAILGLIVNGASVFILDVSGVDHHHGHDHGHTHSHTHTHQHDTNLRGAYYHVLADALTSFLAIFALLAGKYFGWAFMDPIMGIIGALIILYWAKGLLRSTSAVLLDRQASQDVHESIQGALNTEDDLAFVDLHIWCIGPGIHAAEIVIVADEPQTPAHYKSLLPAHLGIVHCVIEVHRKADHPATA